MAKKRKQSSSKYESFKLHGKYKAQKILMYSLSSFIAGFVVGIFVKPYLIRAILTQSMSNGY